MTQKMLMARAISHNSTLGIFDVASVGGHYATRGGARLWDLAKEYMIRHRAKYAYTYRDRKYTFRPGFREFCHRWYETELSRNRISFK